MDGVYVLATCSSTIYYILAVIFTVLAISILCFNIYLFLCQEYSTMVLFSIFGILLVIASILVWYSAFNTQRYKVTIDESVSFVEFMDNYEIISRDGKIFTVEPIDNE